MVAVDAEAAQLPIVGGHFGHASAKTHFTPSSWRQTLLPARFRTHNFVEKPQGPTLSPKYLEAAPSLLRSR